MNMIPPLTVALLLVAGVGRLKAQEVLSPHLPFFEKKAEHYQRWLDANGLGPTLSVDRALLRKEGTELELHLLLRTHDPDTAAGLWRGLETAFTQTNGGRKLTTELFETFARMMEIPSAQGNVQVYIRYPSGDIVPCFYVWMWNEAEVVRDSFFNQCKARPVFVEVRRPNLRRSVNDRMVAVDHAATAEAVFNQVVAYARRRYARAPTDCHERKPAVEQAKIRGNQLTLVVSDLCREVLTDENKSIWCRLLEWMGRRCNDIPRERLEFEFTYLPAGQGYQLTGRLTGKFGSGVYRPRVSGYMDMDPDFEEDYLVPYIVRFEEDLKRYLERPVDGGR